MPPQYSYPSKRASVTEVERSSAHASMMPHNSDGECEWTPPHDLCSIFSHSELKMSYLHPVVSSQAVWSLESASHSSDTRYEKKSYAIRTAGAEAFVNVSFATDDFSLQLPPLEPG